ncbi:MAG: NifB/NifX family molybdenum-iron cluster-binding protein [bacterium]|nr:NifB/NifX family molybdenum-iron cluster-binding protein [bacterium]
MKIAVTYDKGNVFQHFGKTESFKIYEIENNKIIKSYIISNNGITHCALINYLKDNNIDALICGGLGYGAVSKLNELNIKLYAGVSGSADDAVNDLLNNRLDYDNSHTCEDEHLHTCHSDVKPLI